VPLVPPAHEAPEERPRAQRRLHRGPDPRARNGGVTVLCPTFFKTNIFKSSRSTGEAAAKAPVEKLMARARLQADGVARYAIDSVAAGRLHALPHEDGRWLWRAKRAAPGFFSSTVLGKGQRFFK
jgi:short-subunit dehydrogenase